MKQQEIFKKIGGILKELNEQHDYLQSQNDEFSDLDLELFAASAHFLTDHTEILRKLNQHTGGSKIEPVTPAVTQQPEPEPAPTLHHHAELPVDEDIAESFAAPLPPLAESAVVYDPWPVTPETPAVVDEPIVTEEPVAELPVFEQPAPQAEPEYQEPVAEPVVASVEDAPAPEINIEPARQDFYSFMREESQTSAPHHDFSISSSHTEEVSASEPVPAVFTAPAQPEPAFPAPAPAEPEPVQHTEPVKASQDPVVEQPVSAPNLFTSQPAPTPQAPKAEEPVLTLNQRLSAQLHGNTNTATSFQSQSITDLKSAINLNDKMLFVKDLFNGYSLAYSEAIELLNRSKSFDEADRFLKNNYMTKNNWADKPITVEKFYSILRKRFPQ
ncbi:hypothetical protein [Mucilaginibacter lacusdianchii]|uniref:hypothetical protein n=1 Tax=Mucilaginibacter lacusdianchii TaxID=2684211 RepID=UPI00131E80CF|nr:hypothetical protein [Mucilaginibacter sp. JXJ CY 39]